MKHNITDYNKFFFATPVILWPLFTLFLPLTAIIYTSFYHEGTLSLSQYIHFVNPIYHKVIFRSLSIALLTTMGTLLIGYPIAYFIGICCKKKYKMILLMLITLPFWTNFIVQVYSWFFILDKYGLLNQLLLTLKIIEVPIELAYNMWSIIIIMVYCYLPFMIIPLYSAFEKLDPKLLEASMDLGANQLQTFWHITLPLSRSGIKTGTLLVFVPSFGEFVIPTLLGGSKYLTAGSLISYYYIETYNTTLGSAFTVIVGFVLLASVMMINILIHMITKNRNELLYE